MKKVCVVISRDSLGKGPEELGQILVKSFIYSLSELEVAPRELVFFNSGVKLVAEGANTVNDIKALQEKGTEILVCGTCSNYYGIQDKLGVGSISNMGEISKRMVSADSVVNI